MAENAQTTRDVVFHIRRYTPERDKATEAELLAGWGSISCPPMRLAGFNFSSATKF